MYQFLRGIVIEKITGPFGSERLILDVNGIGFEISTTSSALDLFGKKGQLTTVYTTLIHKEDAMCLIGFPTLLERELFNLLCSVSGVGQKTALSLLGGLTVLEITYSILNEDASGLSRAQGIGERTASRIILELKEKIKNWQYLPIAISTQTLNLKSQTSVTDARLALQSLGYSTTEISQAFSQAKVNGDNDDAESLVHFSLKWLSGVRK